MTSDRTIVVLAESVLAGDLVEALAIYGVRVVSCQQAALFPMVVADARPALVFIDAAFPGPLSPAKAVALLCARPQSQGPLPAIAVLSIEGTPANPMPADIRVSCPTRGELIAAALRIAEQTFSEQASEWLDSLEDYTADLQIAPDDTGAHYKIASLLNNLGRKIAYVRQLETLAATCANPLEAVGLVRALLHNSGQSRECLDQLAADLSKQAEPSKVTLLGAHVQDQLSWSPFSRLDRRSLGDFLERLQLIERSADAVLFREGEPAAAAYLLVHGGVIEQRAGDNHDHLISTYDDGAILGVLETLHGASYMSTAVASEKSVFLVIPPAALRELMTRNNGLASAVVARITHQLVMRAVAAIPFFGGLSPKLRGDFIVKCARVQIVQRGCKIYHGRDQVHWLLQGRCQLEKITDQHVIDMREGQIWGALGGAGTNSEPTAIRAQDDALFLTFTHADFVAAFDESSRYGVSIAKAGGDVAGPAASPVAPLSPWELLTALVTEGQSGEMIAAGAQAEIRVFLTDGKIAWAADLKRPKRFTHILIEELGVDRETLHEVVKHCHETRAPVTEVLVQWEVLTVEQIRNALLIQARFVISSLKAGGDYRCLFLPRPDKTMTHGLDTSFTLEELSS